MAQAPKANMNFKTVLLPTIVLVVICLVSTFLLAVTYDITAPLIAERAELAEVEARQLVLPAAESFGEVQTVEVSGTTSTLVPGLDANGETIGYVITGDGKGYGGQVRMLVGVGLDGIVTGATPLILNETAGLGMKAQDQEFLNTLVGKTSGVSVVKNNPGENQIEALTGATITTDAVAAAVNQALEVYEREIVMGGDTSSLDLENNLEAMPAAASFGEPYEVEFEGFTSKITPALDESGEVIGYTVTGDAEGHAGVMTLLVGLDLDGTVTGVQPLILHETASIAVLAEDPEYRAKYVGLKDEITMVMEDPGENEVEAISGATGTSEAFVAAVNRAIRTFDNEGLGQ